MNKYISRLHATRNGCRFPLTAVLGGLLAGLGFAQAETDSTEGILDPLTVTVFRFEQPKAEVPSNVTLIDRDAIIRSGANNLAEVLRDAANLHFTSLAGPTSASLDARGFGASATRNTLIIVDGRVVTRPDMGAFNWTQFPLETIESVEVLKGAHTALYGDRASGSVIKITTRRRTEEPESAIQASYGSFQTENLRFSSSGRIDQLGYTVSGDYFSTDGYRDFSDQRNRSLGFGLDYALTDTLSAYGNFNYLRSDFNLPGALPEDEFYANPKQRGNFLITNNESYVNLGGGIEAKDTGSGILRFDGGAILRKLDFASASLSGTQDVERNLKTFTLSPTWQLERKETIYLVGVDFVRDELDVSGENNNFFFPPPVTIYDADIRRNRFALFGQATHYFSEQLIGNIAARHEIARLKFDYNESTNPTNNDSNNTRSSEQAFSLGLTRLINDNARTWVRFEHFYTYPTTDEIAGYQGFGVFFLSNLDPESGQTLELGGDLRHGNWFFSANPFITRLKNEIYFDGTSFENSNYSHSTLRYGSELTVRYDESLWGIGIQYRYIETEELGGPTKGQRIALVPKHLLQARATLRPAEGLELSAGLRYRGEFDSDNGGLGSNSNAVRIGGTTIYDIKARYQFPFVEGLEVFGSIENLTNKNYTNYVLFGGYYPEAGRSFNLAARYRF
jgi:iron complex outermembrane receptor protein